MCTRRRFRLRWPKGCAAGKFVNLGIIPNRADQIDKLAEKLGKGGPAGKFLLRSRSLRIWPASTTEGTGAQLHRRGPHADPNEGRGSAKLHRSGELTAVWVRGMRPMRDLVRARATAMRVLGKARRYLQGFLLRHGASMPATSKREAGTLASEFE